MGPLSPFSQAHALWARGHFKHRVKGVRWVIKGHESRNVWKGPRLETYPFICHGRLQRKRKTKESQNVKIHSIWHNHSSPGHIRALEFSQSQTVGRDNPALKHLSLFVTCLGL